MWGAGAPRIRRAPFWVIDADLLRVGFFAVLASPVPTRMSGDIREFGEIRFARGAVAGWAPRTFAECILIPNNKAFRDVATRGVEPAAADKRWNGAMRDETSARRKAGLRGIDAVRSNSKRRRQLSVVCRIADRVRWGRVGRAGARFGTRGGAGWAKPAGVVLKQRPAGEMELFLKGHLYQCLET